MIVKDEAPIIEECLRHVCDKFNIKEWVICDTGSSDGTQEIIRKFFELEGIKGELYEDEWKDFGHNRSLAIKRALGKQEYILTWDADDRLVGDISLPTNLCVDAYKLKFGGGNVSYDRPLLVNTHLDWTWVGVLHEFITRSKPGVYSESLRVKGDYYVKCGHFGNRSKVDNKYAKDAEVFEKAIASLDSNGDPWNIRARYAFYCANSYKDAKNYELAAKWYKERINLGGWREEITVSYYELGHQLMLQGKEKEAITAWLEGYSYDPTRASCLFEVANYYFKKGNDVMAYMYAKQASYIPYPTSDGLFVNSSVYNYQIDYLLSITTWWFCKKYQLPIPNMDAIFDNLMSCGAYEKEHIMKNKEFYNG